MAKEIRDPAFFTQPAVELAQALLGKVICHKVHDNPEKPDEYFIIKGRIIMTEAYPFDDPANDSVRYSIETSQNLAGGHLYVCHDGGENYWRFDIVSNQVGVSESVLVRGIDPYGSAPNNSLWAMDFDDTHDGIDLITSKDIWLEDDRITITTKEPCRRNGLSPDLSEECRKKPLCFSVKSIEYK